MISYIIRRLIYAIFVVFGVATVVFFLVRLTGDPATLMLAPNASSEQVEQLQATLGLDKPILQQYLIYLKQLIQLDFGESFKYGISAFKLVIERLPATIELALASLIISLIISFPIGIVAALKPGSTIDKIVMSFALFGQAVPVFWVGLILILVFSVHLNWLPSGGIGGIGNLILPAFSLGLFLTALVTRLLRSSLMESMQSDYVRTAKAKGLRLKKIILKHSLKNSLLPVITVIGLEMGALIGGSVVIETIFSWPGVGQLLIQAITNRDFPLVQAAIIFFSGIFILINLIVDILYVVLDLRIQY